MISEALKLKGKEKTKTLGTHLIEKRISSAELLKFALAATKDTDRATCIESIEFATKEHPELLDKKSFRGVIPFLSDDAPRVKWEAARVIANTAHLHKREISEAVKILLINTEDKGTVVRWSTAFALGEIIGLKTALNRELIPALKSIMQREEKNSIKKIYLAAFKRAEKD